MFQGTAMPVVCVRGGDARGRASYGGGARASRSGGGGPARVRLGGRARRGAGASGVGARSAGEGSQAASRAATGATAAPAAGRDASGRGLRVAPRACLHGTSPGQTGTRAASPLPAADAPLVGPDLVDHDRGQRRVELAVLPRRLLQVVDQRPQLVELLPLPRSSAWPSPVMATTRMTSQVSPTTSRTAMKPPAASLCSLHPVVPPD